VEHLLCELGGNGINRSLQWAQVDVLAQFTPWLQRRLKVLLAALDSGLPEPLRMQTPPELATRAAKLVASLSDDDIDVRERAENELRSSGDPIIPALLDHLKRCRDPEVRARLQELLDSM
jgi:hypothetical protein